MSPTLLRPIPGTARRCTTCLASSHPFCAMAHLLDRHALACADAGNAPCGLQASEEEGALLSTQCVRQAACVCALARVPQEGGHARWWSPDEASSAIDIGARRAAPNAAQRCGHSLHVPSSSTSGNKPDRDRGRLHCRCHTSGSFPHNCSSKNFSHFFPLPFL